MHQCGFGELFQMLCTGSLRLDVSLPNLKIFCSFQGVVGDACLLYFNGVEAEQEGGLHTASIQQDDAHHALDYLGLVLGDWGGFIWGERVMGIFAIFLRGDDIW